MSTPSPPPSVGPERPGDPGVRPSQRSVLSATTGGIDRAPSLLSMGGLPVYLGAPRRTLTDGTYMATDGVIADCRPRGCPQGGLPAAHHPGRFEPPPPPIQGGGKGQELQCTVRMTRTIMELSWQ